MSAEIIVLFIVLALTVLVLSVYLGFILRKLKNQNRIVAEAKAAAEQARRDRQRDIKMSLETLALVVIQEQCDPTEGCIRIKKLLDELEELKDHPQLSVFHRMYEEVKHFAIKEEYKDLSKQEAFKQDNQRYAIEEKYSFELKEASQDLKDILSKSH